MVNAQPWPCGALRLFHPPKATSVCNKYFYNFGAKYSRFRHRSPMGMRKRQFLFIFTTICNAATYILHAISPSPQTLQKAMETALFCLKTRMFALRKWVVCASQLHELSPKSGASAPQNPHIRTICRTICHCQASKTRFSKVKISSRNRLFSARVCNLCRLKNIACEKRRAGAGLWIQLVALPFEVWLEVHAHQRIFLLASNLFSAALRLSLRYIIRICIMR